MNKMLDIALATEAADPEVYNVGGLLAGFGLMRLSDSRVPGLSRRGRRENRRRRYLH